MKLIHKILEYLIYYTFFKIHSLLIIYYLYRNILFFLMKLFVYQLLLLIFTFNYKFIKKRHQFK